MKLPRDLADARNGPGHQARCRRRRRAGCVPGPREAASGRPEIACQTLYPIPYTLYPIPYTLVLVNPKPEQRSPATFIQYVLKPMLPATATSSNMCCIRTLVS